eukprot:m.1361285 g.1361285  ORF g.1361285 m.1361285 type:complete len:1107 (-) comp24941_c0_seq4:255-3575(-)
MHETELRLAQHREFFYYQTMWHSVMPTMAWIGPVLMTLFILDFCDGRFHNIKFSGKTGMSNVSYAPLWLNWNNPTSPSYRHGANLGGQLVCTNQTATEPLGRACQEIFDGLVGMMSITPAIVTAVDARDSVIINATINTHLDRFSPWPPHPEIEGFSLFHDTDANNVVIQGNSGVGALYGTFRLLHLIRTEVAIKNGFNETDAPSLPLRMWDLWDNRDRSVERGYAGKSVFYYEDLPTMQARYRDYARLLASTGINAIVWDNVNACGNDNEKMLTHDVLTSMTPLVQLFFDYGIRSFLTPCYSSPILVGGLKSADPFDPNVAKWWEQTAVFINNTWTPQSFGGFLVKADCEGQPGPATYNRTELEGANALADALAPVGGICIWRAFAHPPHGEDQALYQFNLFKSWKNQPPKMNVVLQIKNGPFDFQVREPVHALFGYLSDVNLIVEFEATQEYLGQAKHVCHLPSQWSTYLAFDTYLGGQSNSTLAAVVSGQLRTGAAATWPRYTGIAAVSNLGSNPSWTGHPFSAANTYGFGRLAWQPALDPGTLTTEWIGATYGIASATVAATVSDILMSSWEAYENYTSSLGWGFVCSSNHYTMDPEARQDYINASNTHIGNNRGIASGFGGMFNEPLREKFLDVEQCPEELLLCFHNVPYTHVLHGARYGQGNATVLSWIYDSHTAGAATAARYVGLMSALGPTINTTATGVTFNDTIAILQQGAADAATFASTVTTWVSNKVHGIPPPSPPPPGPPIPAPPGFIGSRDHFCSTGSTGQRAYDNKESSLSACAALCAANTTCACFDMSRSGTECRWVTVADTKPSSEGDTAYVKTKFSHHPRKARTQALTAGGARWFKSRSNMSVSANATDGTVAWMQIEKPDVIVTYLDPPMRITTASKLRLRWKSDGLDECDAKSWHHHGYCKNDEPCMHRSIHCLAGTGDFRIFVGDTAGGERVTADNFAPTTSYSHMDKYLESPPFNGYKGYDFRTFPHVSIDADRYVPKMSGSTAVPCSINRKDSSALFGKARLKYFGCFEAPTGQWTDLILEISEHDKKGYTLAMTMNNVTRSIVDADMPSELRPKVIDVIAIQYPNGRNYSYVQLGEVEILSPS